MLFGCNGSNGGNDEPIYDDLIAPPTYKEDSVSIHYYRKDRSFEKWALWLWDYPAGEGVQYDFNGIDEYGAVAAYPLSTWSENILKDGLGFIVKGKELSDWTKDFDGDRIIDFSKFEKDSNNIYNVYIESGKGEIYTNSEKVAADAIISAEFTDSSTIKFSVNNDFESYKIYENDKVIKEGNATNNAKTIEYRLTDHEASFDYAYKAEVKFKLSQKTISSIISTKSLYKTTDFEKKYTYTGNDLGVTYTAEKSTFKVWSPVSSEVQVNIYDNGTPKSLDASKGNDDIKSFMMNKGSNGVFSTIIEEDIAGKYYTYTVKNSSYPDGKEIVDPYAKSCGVNGLRGQIVDFTKTNPENWNESTPHAIDRKALTVYETHICDITSDSSWGGTETNAKLFNGAYEENTKYSSDGVNFVTTGFDHIKELGVNAVQFIPIFDQANDEINKSFNWGYNPLNYNCLEGSFSSNPYDGYVRIKEFKNLVKAYNKAGINIIMDVVYNHVNSAAGSNFDVLMPGYYYRYNANGGYSNGSGCGNETASEMPMFRKFMIDSAMFWAKEYKLGGFRFDLMGLHDLETMKQLTSSCKEINSSIAIYGEPWTGGTSTLSGSLSAKQLNGNNYVGYGQFNDQMRDALIKGGLNGPTSIGWVDNNTSAISSSDVNRLTNGIKGITSNEETDVNKKVYITDPDKTTNYVTCHDNYTLNDRFLATQKFGRGGDLLKKMNVLANSVVFTSQGTTFMLAGEEFLRTKNGNSNSYNASYSVNALKYNLKARNIDMVKNYQKLISLKQNLDGLHLDKSMNQNLNVSLNSNFNTLDYVVKDSKNNKEYRIIHTNGYKTSELAKLNLDGYTLYLDTINPEKELTSSTQLEAYETLIAYK